MPTYEYICTKCGHEFEAFQSITEEPVKKCPKCGGKVQRKISGGAGLIFKGTGFYITDYKKSNAPKTSSDSSKSESKPKTDSSSKPTDSSSSKSSDKN